MPVTEIDYFPQPKQAEMHMSNATEILFGGAAGGGKGSPLSSLILTPFGFKTMGSLKIGSLVCSPDGSISNVIAIYPLGKKQLYKFSFNDGASCEVTEDHIWLAWENRGSSKNNGAGLSGESGAKLWVTSELYKRVNNGSKINIPITNPVTFTDTSRYPGRPINPYQLGVILGDGSIKKGVPVSLADKEIADKIDNICKDEINPIYYDKQNKIYRWSHKSTSKTIKYLKKFGLYGKLAIDKFIPEAYLLGSQEERWELLRGLMDTDGWSDKDGDIYFCSISKQLIKDVTFLARSLGAFVTERKKRPFYKDKNNNKVECSEAYTIRLKFIDSSMAFHLTRKKIICGRVPQSMHRKIISIEKTGIDDCQCIKVSNPNGLYITNDFIVTHNSKSLRMEALRWCISVPGIQVYLFRRTFPELEKNHIIASRVEFPDSIGKYREQLRRWEFFNGSMLHFCHCQYENDVFNYQGAEIHVLLMDELTSMTEFIYDYLRARVRCTLKIPKEFRAKIPRIVCASNPGGIGHVYAKNRWVDYLQPMEIKRAPEAEGGMLRQFIPSKLQDNDILMELDPGYISRLDALPEPYRTAYKDGNWNIFFGQAFDFDRKYHVIPQQETIPDNYPLYMTFDWGFGKPFSIGWWFVDNDDRTVRYEEWYGWNGTPDQGIRLTDSQIAEGILERELKLGIAGKDVARYAGPDCFSKKPDYRGGGQGKSTAEVFSDYGLYLTPGDADRKLKFRQFRERLRVKKDDNGEVIEPPMMLVTSNCEAFIRTIPLIQTDPRNPEEIDTKGEDHVLDEVCHICMARPMGNTVRQEKKTLNDKLIDRIERPSYTPSDEYEKLALYDKVIDDRYWDGFLHGNADLEGMFIDTV